MNENILDEDEEQSQEDKTDCELAWNIISAEDKKIFLRDWINMIIFTNNYYNNCPWHYKVWLEDRKPLVRDVFPDKILQHREKLRKIWEEAGIQNNPLSSKEYEIVDYYKKEENN